MELCATLLEEGHYHCSARTMYRLLVKTGRTRERRTQLLHPTYQKPELLASAANQLWSWEITKLLGPAKQLFVETCANQNIKENTLTIHADRGSSMTSKPVAARFRGVNI